MAEPTITGRLPVIIGDDQGEEFGFAAAALLGSWAVRAGPGLTHAQFRLRDVNAVRRWFAALLLQSSIPRAYS